MVLAVALVQLAAHKWAGAQLVDRENVQWLTSFSSLPSVSDPVYQVLTGWMGANRDGRVQSLPRSLPVQPNILWERELTHSGLGGLAVWGRFVVFGDRDTADQRDVWRCLDAQTGKTLWEVIQAASGKLDYGNSPRTTPLMFQEVDQDGPVSETARAVLLGAFGDLLCVDLETGLVEWRLNIAKRFGATGERPWGYCGSPLLIDGRLIVTPGSSTAAIAALDPDTGDVLWTGMGQGVGHGSLVVATLGGRRQIVGHDQKSLVGWDIEKGQQLWQVTPINEGDFNVATPVVDAGKLYISTENNGTRVFQFDQSGSIIQQPVAFNAKLHPDMSTPLIAGERLVAVHRLLYVLNVRNGLKEVARIRDPAFGDYAASITDGKRFLIFGKGELLLVDPLSDPAILDRCRVFDQALEIYSHPALVEDRLFIRGDRSLRCIQLSK